MELTRREFIKDTAIAGMTLGIGLEVLNAEAGIKVEKGKKSSWKKSNFHFVHITDQHVYDKRKGNEGYETCLRSIEKLKKNPDFLLNGGDMVFDGNYNEKSDYIRWIKQYKEIHQKFGIPNYPCMGNHDAFGYGARRKTTPDDPDIGKKIIQDLLEWEKTYYSFDHEGWHFAVLDVFFLWI